MTTTRTIHITQSEADAIDAAITMLHADTLNASIIDPALSTTLGRLRMVAAKYRWAGSPLRKAQSAVREPLPPDVEEELMADALRMQQREDELVGTPEDWFDGSP